VPLIAAGKLVGSLVSPRTAREFGLPENGANGAEMPESLAMGGGTLAADDALAALDTGLAVGNLHYLNYSDRPACRITGMTRFATFWVENGKVVAPVDVLRFDDTVYRMLGANLEALTAETEFILDAGTYQSRQLASVRLPGALVARYRGESSEAAHAYFAALWTALRPRATSFIRTPIAVRGTILHGRIVPAGPFRSP